MRVFTGTEQLYTIDSVGAQTFYTVKLYIKEFTGFDGPPSGEVLVFDPDGRQTIPNLPFGSAGATSQMNSAINTYNARLIGQAAEIVVDTTGLIYINSTELQGALTDLDSAILSASSSLAFDGNRNVLRTPNPGDNLATSTVTGWLEWWYFTAPTISLSQVPPTSVWEVGDSTQLIYSGTVTNSGGATLSNGLLLRTVPSADTLVSFAAATSFLDTIQFVPTQDSTSHYKQFQYTFKATQEWVSGAESGTAQSPSVAVYGAYPILFGMSAQDSLGVLAGNPYTDLETPLVEREGNKNITFNGTNAYLYLMIPNTWGDTDFSLILDHNGFTTTSTWKKYTVLVSSTGLVNNWTAVNYTCYQWPIKTTATNYTYEFTQ